MFLNLGDSNPSAFSPYAPGYLTPLGTPGYNPYLSGLAESDPQLISTWNTYLSPVANGLNSFYHVSSVSVPGFAAANLLATVGAEVSATDGGIALIMIGTNDAFLGTSPTVFQSELTQLVTVLIDDGIVPVLSTIPDLATSLGGVYESVALTINQVIANVAGSTPVPLWNTWLALSTLPNDGIQSYGVHLNVSPAGGGAFDPVSLEYGQNVRNLDALEILNWYQTEVVNGTPDPVARTRLGRR